MSQIARVARKAAASGYSVIPCSRDKRPLFGWKPFQRRRAEEAEVEGWFVDEKAEAMAIVCGEISGHLEVIDFDVPEGETNSPVFEEWCELVENHAPGLLERLPVVETPSGGKHVYVRSESGDSASPCSGNTKLAMLTKTQVLVETRGEGGYVLAPPSPGYTMAHLKLSAVPTLTLDERDLLFGLARSFHQLDEPEPEPVEAASADRAGTRPGDAFNDDPKALDLLRAELRSSGWKLLRRRTSGAEEWKRPGKDTPGISATLGHIPGKLYVFSSNAYPFDAPRVYSPFSAWTLLAHGGDFSESSKALASLGYGASDTGETQKAPRVFVGSSQGDGAPGEAPDVDDAEADEGEETRESTWPYRTDGGRIWFLRKSSGGELIETLVSDFSATIRREIAHEDGSKLYEIAGKTKKGRPFSCEIPADRFEEERSLKSAVGGAAGGQAAVYAGQTKHLPPAIKRLSAGSIVETRRYLRTGWMNGAKSANRRFLIPGREPEGVEVEVRGLPYSASGGDLDEGLVALDALMRSHGAGKGAVILSHVLAPPLYAVTGIQHARSGLHVHGLTGSLKTSLAKAMMCIWGAGFNDEANLLKWGTGATGNALMKLASEAADLPFYVDNYKRGTGGGAKAFVEFIHNVMEGGEKRRAKTDGTLRDSAQVSAWPLTTGEDTPDTDASSIARMLVVRIGWPAGTYNEDLAVAQERAEHLPAVGRAWLDFLESAPGMEAAEAARKAFAETMRRFASYLIEARESMMNPNRVATSLAMNYLAFHAAATCPALAPVLAPRLGEHQAALQAVADDMAVYGGEAREATRFLSALKQVVASGRAILKSPALEVASDERDRMIGWHSPMAMPPEDGVVYLLPEAARQVVDRLLGPDGLGGISNQALYAQLDDLGLLVATGDGSMTKVKSISGKKWRLLWLRADALFDEDAPQGKLNLGDEAPF